MSCPLAISAPRSPIKGIAKRQGRAHCEERLAAAHFRDRGYKRVYCLGISPVYFDILRRKGVLDAAQRDGLEAATLPSALSSRGRTTDSLRILRGLPRQIGVFAYNDLAYCTVMQPRLSTIDPAADLIGFQAATLLGGLLAGDASPVAPILVPPRGIVARGRPTC